MELRLLHPSPGLFYLGGLLCRGGRLEGSHQFLLIFFHFSEPLVYISRSLNQGSELTGKGSRLGLDRRKIRLGFKEELIDVLDRRCIRNVYLLAGGLICRFSQLFTDRFRFRRSGFYGLDKGIGQGVAGLGRFEVGETFAVQFKELFFGVFRELSRALDILDLLLENLGGDHKFDIARFLNALFCPACRMPHTKEEEYQGECVEKPDRFFQHFSFLCSSLHGNNAISSILSRLIPRKSYASTLNNTNKNHHDGNDDEDMNESAHRVGGDNPQKPENNQKNSYKFKHFTSPIF